MHMVMQELLGQLVIRRWSNLSEEGASLAEEELRFKQYLGSIRLYSIE